MSESKRDTAARAAEGGRIAEGTPLADSAKAPAGNPLADLLPLVDQAEPPAQSDGSKVPPATTTPTDEGELSARRPDGNSNPAGPFAAAAAYSSPEHSGAFAAVSPSGEVRTSVETVRDGATTIVTTTTVTTTTITTTTQTFVTGELPQVETTATPVQQPIRVGQFVAPLAVPEATSDPENADHVRPAYSKSVAYRVIKRTLDILFSAMVVIVGLIPGLILSLAIAISTKGSPFYKQKRVRRGGREFNILKFRTMVVDADDLEKHLSPEQIAEWHAEHKVKDDPRITKLGGFLRRTSIDELPNFLNVLAGQMSIVGPRAITKEELHWFGNDVGYMLSVPAGITGWWQVISRNDATFESGERQELELYYVENASLGLDARIFFMTFGAVFTKTGK